MSKKTKKAARRLARLDDVIDFMGEILDFPEAEDMDSKCDDWVHCPLRKEFAADVLKIAKGESDRQGGPDDNR